MGSSPSSEGCGPAAATDSATEGPCGQMWLNDASRTPTAAWLSGSAPSQEAKPRAPVEPRRSTLLSTPAPAEGSPTKADHLREGQPKPLALPSDLVQSSLGRELEERRPTEEPGEPILAASRRGDAVAVGSSADAGRGWPTAGRLVGHTARAAPGNRVFCVTSGGNTMTLYHAGEEAPAPVAVCGFCGALPREPAEEGAPASACRRCAQWQDRRAAEITCVHSVEEENGAPALYCCARSGAISKRGLRGGVVCGAVQGHPGWTSCALVLGRCLLVGSDDGRVRAWDLGTGQQTRTLEGPAAGLPVCLLAPRGGAAGTLFCGYNDGAVLAWSLEDGRLRVQAGGRWPSGHSRSVRCLCDGGGAGVFSGSNDSTVGRWDASTGAALWNPALQLPGWASCMLAWEPAGCLLVGCEDGSIQSRGLLDGEAHQRFEPAGRKAHGAAVTSLLALEASGWLFSGAADGGIRKWQLGTGELLQSLEVHGGAVMCMLACEAEDSLLSGSSDAALCRWSLQTGRLLHTTRVPEGKVTGFVVKAAPEPPAARPPEPAGEPPEALGSPPGSPRSSPATPYTPNTPSSLSCPLGHALEPTVVSAPQRAGMSPGSCDRCARDMVEGELVNECPQCNYWMCSACAARDRSLSSRGLSKGTPAPLLSAKVAEPKNANVPFSGWMRHQFKVSDVRARVQREVRGKIAAAHGRPAAPEPPGGPRSEAPASPRPEAPASPRPEAPGAAEEPAEDGAELVEEPAELVEEPAELVEEPAELVDPGADAPAGGGIFGGASGSTAMGPAEAPAAGQSSSAAASQSQSQSWIVSNEGLRSRAPGLGYRCSPSLEDKHPDKLMARWGRVICGVDMGNNFVRTTSGTIGYLPKVFQGQQVLVLVGGPAAAAA